MGNPSQTTGLNSAEDVFAGFNMLANYQARKRSCLWGLIVGVPFLVGFNILFLILIRDSTPNWFAALTVFALFPVLSTACMFPLYQAYGDAVKILNSLANDCGREVVVTADAFGVFVGVLHDSDRHFFVKRGIMRVRLPWSSVKSWKFWAAATSASEGSTYTHFYRIESDADILKDKSEKYILIKRSYLFNQEAELVDSVRRHFHGTVDTSAW